MTLFTNDLAFRSTLWNLPIQRFDNRLLLFNSIISDWMEEYQRSGQWKPGGRQLDFLEIGVWKAETIVGVQSFFNKAFRYVGLDPYGQLIDDPYAGLFWKSDEESEAVYQSALGTFEMHGGELLRLCSDDFFARDQRQFDVIFVDGDHRYAGALADMENGINRLRPGGLLIVDDVGNNFHPEVEWAVRQFYDKHLGEFDRYGVHPLFFLLEGMSFPVMLQFAVLRKKLA